MLPPYSNVLSISVIEHNALISVLMCIMLFIRVEYGDDISVVVNNSYNGISIISPSYVVNNSLFNDISM